jgi:hypothetical protein
MIASDCDKFYTICFPEYFGIYFISDEESRDLKQRSDRISFFPGIYGRQLDLEVRETGDQKVS